MTSAKRAAIKRLVNDGVRRKIKIAQETKQLEAIKRKLAELGAQYPNEWEPIKDGGDSWLAPGTGYYARITYPKRRLKDVFDASTATFLDVRKAAKTAKTDCFNQLFEAANCYKTRENFRELAKQLLGENLALKLIKLCESDSKPTVNFEAGTIEERQEKEE